MRAVGTFGLAKKDVSGENKKNKKTERKRKRDLLAGQRRRRMRRVGRGEGWRRAKRTVGTIEQRGADSDQV